MYLIEDICRLHWDRLVCPAVWTLLDDLDAFYLEHRRCGRLDADVEDGRIWMACECGAAFSRGVWE